MVSASPFRHLPMGIALATGAVLLWLTRPRLAFELAPGQNQSASCLSNLNQIARAYALYARDFDGKIPLAVDPEDRFNPQIWTSQTTSGTLYESFLQTAPFVHIVLRPYVASPTVFRCPSDRGWTTSRLQANALTGGSQALSNVQPSSFARYGTSYYSWTIYGFNLLGAADISDPARKVVLFDGELWHRSGNREWANELFLDGHARSLSKAQHDSAAPDRNFW